MLDQNTDRMWYVIGAVLVGAAIILIANGTLPQMFASVTGSFDGAIDGISYHMAIGQYGDVDNLFTFNESTFEYDMMPNRTNGLRNPNPIANNWYSTSHLISVKAGSKYRFTAPDKVCSPMILYYGADGEYLGHDYKNGDFVDYVDGTAPDGTSHVRIAAGDMRIDPTRGVDTVDNWMFFEM